MVDDPVELIASCRAFAAAVPQTAVLEDELGRCSAAFARELGWRTALRFALRLLDAPKVGQFPQRLHQHTGSIRFDGSGGAELALNANAIDDAGSFPLLVARLPVFLWLFGAALERRPELAGELAFFPGDACLWDAVASSGNHPDACLIPDPDYFRTAGCAEFRAATETVPHWEARRAAVHWRGSTTGIKRYWPPAAPDDTGWLPRLDLCARVQSEALAPLCDVGYMQLVQVPPAERSALESALAGLRRAPVEKLAAAAYKAVIDIDGNSNTWSSGLYSSLLAGACVIKIASEHGFRQWYYDRLVPWVHYVPVRADLADLEEKVRLVITGDEPARTIAAAGRELARSMDFAAELASSVGRLIAWSDRKAERTPSAW